MKRMLLSGILGGVVAFIWSAIAHMNPLTGMMGLSILNDKEDAVLAALKTNIQKPGLYFFPGMDMSRQSTKEERQAWTAKMKAGPVGLVLYHPDGGDPMTPGQLLVEFLSTLVCGMIAAYILASIPGSLVRRAVTVALLGLFAWVAISISQWNFYAYPFSFIALDAIDQVIGWFLAGLLIAKLLKPPALAPPVATASAASS